VLTRIGGLPTPAIRLDLDEVVVGREKGLTASVADTSVSRRHARITRRTMLQAGATRIGFE
jgi:pSer/pThr/pTyr-binding forkhead associated (FHA) protein